MPTAAPFPAANYFPVDTASPGSALTRTPGVFQFGNQNANAGSALTTVIPIQQIVEVDPNATAPKYYSQVDVVFASFSESRVSSYLKSLAQVINISQTRVQPVYRSADGRVSLEFGKNYIFSVQILTPQGRAVANNVTHALAFALAGNVTLLAAQVGTAMNRFTVLYATAVYPLPYSLTLVPVGVNYVWVAFILFGLVCCCLAVVAIFCKGSGSEGSGSAPESPKQILDRVPGDVLDENREQLHRSVEKFQRGRSMHLLAEARSGKSLLGAASAERAVVSRVLEKDERALFLREMDAMPVQVLLQHDRLFQLPPEKEAQDRAMKRLVSVTKSAKAASKASDDSGSTDDDNNSKSTRSARQLVSLHNNSMREQNAKALPSPADSVEGTRWAAGSKPSDLPSSVARFVESDDEL